MTTQLKKLVPLDFFSSNTSINQSDFLKWIYLNPKQRIIKNKCQLLFSYTNIIEYLHSYISPREELNTKLALIIDDDQDIYEYIKIELKKQNIETLWAKNGLEAYYLIKKHQPFIVTLDLKMNIFSGNDFLNLLDHIKIKNRPWIVTISSDTTPSIEKSLLSGGDYFINKPLQKEYFNNLIQKIIDKQLL